MLRLSVASVLGLAAVPSLALAEPLGNVVATPPARDDWSVANPIGGPVWAVTTGEASLRAQPDIADNRFGFARTGTPLQVLGSSGDWTYVFNPRTQGTAYVSTSLLKAGDPPSRFVSLPAPPLLDEFQDTIVVTQDSILAYYPSPVDEARFMPIQASTVQNVNGVVQGVDGALWYQTSDFYYIPAEGVFRAGDAGSYAGRWLSATLLPTTRVIAFDGQTPVRTMLALRGIAKFPTPVGTFSILRRVPNETMDSMTLGIPHDSPYGYLVKNVLYTQYFTPDGASLHDNYWSSNFGGIGSHGCLGLSLGDSKWLWDWAYIGVPVIVNSA
ncbi:MAG: L,D-transpeptidase family protein [Chloroflexi bacterium]|nr:L,D-transpeptidase family protein [Chloroflexota bacterium]MBV9898374.1 L,D-transpeptidase family protein [Chloroflexota bacterium]